MVLIGEGKFPDIGQDKLPPEPTQNMKNVVVLKGMTYLDIDADRVLNGCIGKYKKGAIVLGYDDDGVLQIHSSLANAESILWMLQKASNKIITRFSDE